MTAGNNGRVKWLMWLFGFVVMISFGMVGLNRAAIVEMPDKYVRLERYKCDIDDIKVGQQRILRKLDRISFGDFR